MGIGGISQPSSGPQIPENLRKKKAGSSAAMQASLSGISEAKKTSFSPDEVKSLIQKIPRNEMPDVMAALRFLQSSSPNDWIEEFCDQLAELGKKDPKIEQACWLSLAQFSGLGEKEALTFQKYAADRKFEELTKLLPEGNVLAERVFVRMQQRMPS